MKSGIIEIMAGLIAVVLAGSGIAFSASWLTALCIIPIFYLVAVVILFQRDLNNVESYLHKIADDPLSVPPETGSRFAEIIENIQVIKDIL